MKVRHGLRKQGFEIPDSILVYNKENTVSKRSGIGVANFNALMQFKCLSIFSTILSEGNDFL